MPAAATGQFEPDVIPALDSIPPPGSLLDDNPYLAPQGVVTATPAGHYLLAIDPNERP
jgi:hypothetical protein